MVKYIENYALYESIGSGVYGKVYRAINNNDKKEYAIKVIPISKFKENKKLEECTVNEINILTNIEVHANIIKYFDMLKTSNNFYFIYQFCNGGTLENLLAKQGKLTEQSALLIFKQLLEAFQILNKYNIMHRDMKPDNIFFHNGVIKLGDFGFCKNLNSADQMTRTMLGSPIYMAPEVLKGQIYSNKADIWSLGVVLYEMVYGMCPFQSNSIANLIEVLNSKELQFPGQISPFLKNLIMRMLTKDSMRRVSWMELFQIKINNNGDIETEKVIQRINSLHEAKIFDENQGQIAQSSKTLGKLEVVSSDEPMGNFKKHRNVSITNQPNTPLTGINLIQNIPYNNSINGNSTNGSVNSITQSKPISRQPIYSTADTPKNYIKEKTGEEHRIVLEALKIIMEIIQNKLPNHLGYAHLILTKTLALLAQIAAKVNKKEISEILEKESKQLQQERQLIASKMYAYELKGLEDWKKYLRGKFFEEETTIVLWFKMVTFLNGSYGMHNVNQGNFGEIVKQILY